MPIVPQMKKVGTPAKTEQAKEPLSDFPRGSISNYGKIMISFFEFFQYLTYAN